MAQPLQEWGPDGMLAIGEKAGPALCPEQAPLQNLFETLVGDWQANLSPVELSVSSSVKEGGRIR